MNFLLIKPLIGALILVSPTLMLACVKFVLAFTIANLAWSNCCFVTPPVLKAFSDRV